MKVIDKINNSKGKTLFSVEILPPLKGKNIQTIFNHLDPLMRFNPAFINVTYHREEFVYKEREKGLFQKQIIRKRPGTVGICAAIQNKYNVDAVPHILCGGFSKEDTENLLIDLDFLGIENVLALRGDAIKSETYFRAEPDGHHYASELITQIKDLNKGKYLDETLENTTSTQFCVGASCYPEKHMESPSLDQDIKYLKHKIECGAEYVVSQMVFDAKKFIDFVKKCRKEGITVPIIPGLKPLASKRQLNILPHRFHVDLPDELVHEALCCKDNEAVKQLGVEWCIQQSKELKDFGVEMVHYYSMGKSDSIEKIVEEIF